MAETSTEMMEENGTETANQEQKTFTQEELDKIVQSRVIHEQKRYADYETLKEKAARLDSIEEANKTELQKATEKAESLQAQIDALTKQNELRDIRSKVSKELNIPAELLTAETEEACRTQADAILKFARPNGYPTVQDGGQPQKATITKESILSDIQNGRTRDALKAIQDNIKLFE